MELMDHRKYYDLAVLLSRMVHDLPGTRDSAEFYETEDEDCILICQAILSNEDVEEPWVGFYNRLKHISTEYIALLDLAMQIVNEYDKKRLQKRNE